MIPRETGPVRVDLPHEAFTLPNGLRVIVHEDRSVPLVAVNIWYHVGSKDERPGRTGFAHLFEHLMFEGSAHAPAGTFDTLLEAVGGINNGSTSPDRTNYYEMLPANALELALWLESDRMGWLLPAMSQRKLDAQRDVVKNERRQSYENRPYGRAFETILAALFPPMHPYHWPVIGSMADLDAATLEDVHEFFRTYYAPNNASLVIAGAADAASVRPLVERYFGEIPRGPEPPAVAAPAVATTGGRRLVLEDDVRLPRLYVAWPSPAYFAEGDAALDAVATILAEGKASRLHRVLVYERGIAQDVQAFQDSRRLGSVFFVVVTARPDVSLAELEREVRRQLEALAVDGPGAGELDRARNRIETAFIDELQHVLGRADRLNLYAYYAGDPGYAEADLARFRRLEPRDVAAAVRRYLLDAAPVVLSVVPRGRRDLAAGEGE
ncbi:MAG TPA: pitrilysin family protein [Longimicrobiales bacterium]